MDAVTARAIFESGNELANALRMKAINETAQHLSVIKMLSNGLGNQRKLLERTLAMFDGNYASGDLNVLLDDIRNHLEGTK